MLLEQKHTRSGHSLRGEVVNDKIPLVFENDNTSLLLYTGNSNRILLEHSFDSITNDTDSDFKTTKLNIVFAETASLETLTYWARSGLQSPLIAELREFWIEAMKSPFKLKLREPDKYLINNGPYDPSLQ